MPGDQLRAESWKLSKAFPQTLSIQRSAWKSIPFFRFKTQHQRDFLLRSCFPRAFQAAPLIPRCKNPYTGGAVKSLELFLPPFAGTCQWQPGGHWQRDTSMNHSSFMFPIWRFMQVEHSSPQVTVQCYLMILILGAFSEITRLPLLPHQKGRWQRNNVGRKAILSIPMDNWAPPRSHLHFLKADLWFTQTLTGLCACPKMKE